MVHNTMAEAVLITFLFLQTIEILIKFLEAMPQISSIATNVIKLPSQKMADTSKDELLFIMISGFGIYGAAVVPYSGACNTSHSFSMNSCLLGRGIRHITARHCIMHTVNKFLLA